MQNDTKQKCTRTAQDIGGPCFENPLLYVMAWVLVPVGDVGSVTIMAVLWVTTSDFQISFLNHSL